MYCFLVCKGGVPCCALPNSLDTYTYKMLYLRLGHPSNVVLKVLKPKLNFKSSKDVHVSDICHKSK